MLDSPPPPSQVGGVLILDLTYKALIEPFIQPREITVDDNTVRRPELLNLEKLCREETSFSISVCVYWAQTVSQPLRPHTSISTSCQFRMICWWTSTFPAVKKWISSLKISINNDNQTSRLDQSLRRQVVNLRSKGVQIPWMFLTRQFL